MARRETLRYAALALAILTATGIAWYLIFVPYSLRVAVAPPGSEPAQLLTAMAHALEREKARVRLTVIAYPDNQATSAAVDNGKADLAVVRSDVALPASGLGVAIAHQIMVVLAARSNAGIERFSELRQKSVGVVGQGPGNKNLFDTLASLHGLTPEMTRVVPLTSFEQIGPATTNGQIDALFIAGPRGGRAISQAIKAFQDALDNAPTIVPIDNAAALAKRINIFTADKIAPGEIRSAPALPFEEIATVTFPSLIVAHRKLAEAKVYEFTKQLFALRPAFIGQHQAAARIEALPTERGSAFSVHPGAVTYYDASEKTILEDYSDVLWLALFGFSGVASLAAWLFSLAFPKRREIVRSEHEELISMMEAARTAPTLSEIDKIDRRTDQLVALTSQLVFDGGIDSDQQPAFDLLLKRIGAILDKRRRELGYEPTVRNQA